MVTQTERERERKREVSERESVRERNRGRERERMTHTNWHKDGGQRLEWYGASIGVNEEEITIPSPAHEEGACCPACQRPRAKILGGISEGPVEARSAHHCAHPPVARTRNSMGENPVELSFSEEGPHQWYHRVSFSTSLLHSGSSQRSLVSCHVGTKRSPTSAKGGQHPYMSSQPCPSMGESQQLQKQQQEYLCCAPNSSIKGTNSSMQQGMARSDTITIAITISSTLWESCGGKRGWVCSGRGCTSIKSSSILAYG